MQYFVIKISDNGTGVSAEKISHIFEPFFTNKDKGYRAWIGYGISNYKGPRGRYLYRK